MVAINVLIYSPIVVRHIEVNDFISAKVGTKIASVPFQKGFYSSVKQKEGVMGDPVEAFLFIQLTKPTGKSIRIQALKDFNGAVKIQSKEDALKFCRIWTDHHFFWWFQPSALEVRYDPTRKLNGYGGSVRNHKWWKVVSSYPMLSQTSDQFVVKRLLIISKNRMRVKCYVSTETVGRNGEYSLSLDKFSVDKDFDSIFWYLPTVG